MYYQTSYTNMSTFSQLYLIMIILSLCLPISQVSCQESLVSKGNLSNETVIPNDHHLFGSSAYPEPANSQCDSKQEIMKKAIADMIEAQKRELARKVHECKIQRGLLPETTIVEPSTEA